MTTQKPNKWNAVLAVTGAGLAAVAIAGCGDDDDKAVQEAPTPRVAQPSAPAQVTGPTGPPKARPERSQPKLSEQGHRSREMHRRGERVLRGPGDADDQEVTLLISDGDIKPMGPASRGKYIVTYIAEPKQSIELKALGELNGTVIVDGPGANREIKLSRTDRRFKLKALQRGERYVISLKGGDAKVLVKAR